MTKNKRTRIVLLEKGYTLKTYNQWMKLGFGVNTGETSLCRNEYGQALFTDKQVTERGGR